MTTKSAESSNRSALVRRAFLALVAYIRDLKTVMLSL
jgi:hypothetical protein